MLPFHVGPGFPYDYREPLEAQAEGRPIIFYDQMGCGSSDRPDDPSLWRLAVFLDRLGTVGQA